ncbi:hypothetical protein SCHPADRAFT_286813 [Schizopora paradoxa]|uniref:Uncharacterized protein n=1 Tax=Schizopora paradoxa TaxID=27342 RepID=A0A0H2RTQ8_9AGAM|nr:hypothetical protein SCHPADRAFT_286813 [Schizopora paradoxa]
MRATRKRENKAGPATATQGSLLSMWNIKKDDGNAVIPVPPDEALQVNEAVEPTVLLNDLDDPSHEGSTMPQIVVENEHETPDTLTLQKKNEVAPVKSNGKPIRATRSRSGGESRSVPESASQPAELFSIFSKKTPTPVDEEKVAGPSTVAEIALAATKAKPKRSRNSSRRKVDPPSNGRSHSPSAVIIDEQGESNSAVTVQDAQPITLPPLPPISTIPDCQYVPFIDVDLLDAAPPPQSPLEGSQNQPILVESSPVKALRSKPGTSSVSFFAPRKSKASQQSSLPRNRKRCFLPPPKVFLPRPLPLLSTIMLLPFPPSNGSHLPKKLKRDSMHLFAGSASNPLPFRASCRMTICRPRNRRKHRCRIKSLGLKSGIRGKR